MTFKYKYRKQIIIIACIIIVISLVSFLTISKTYKKKTNSKSIVLKKKTAIKNEPEELKHYKVDIKGEISNPGIYTMLENDRVVDVIEKAGGLTQQADTTVINLSKKVIDEMVIIIYSKDEVINFKKTKEEESKTLEICVNNEKELKNDACIEDNNAQKELKTDNKVNINTASKEELMNISGIGESKADNIIKYRNENGGFKTIEEIQNITGIGESIFAKIKENIII